MDLDIARQWTAALRSGEYQQGVDALNEAGKFCCLGVLCDMAVKAGVSGLDVATSSIGTVSYNNHHSLPPKRVLGWAGLGDEYGTIDMTHLTGPWADSGREEPAGLEPGLAELNDYGLTFDQIADLIDNFAATL